MQFKQLLVLMFGLLTMTAVNTTYAQTNYQNLTFNIDSLTEVGKPKSALAEVKKLDELARKNANTPYIIRAVIYRMGLQAHLEEDALNNIINQLRADVERAGYPEKPIFQSLLAAMYWEHYKANRWNFNQRTRQEKPDADITHWHLQTIVTESDRMYRQSLQNTSQLQNTPVSVLNGVLAGDSATRYLRPTLYDLLVHRALAFYLNTEVDLPRPRAPFNLANEHFFSDSRSFAAATINSTDTSSLFYRGLLLLQQATAFHLQKENTEAVADLDLKRLAFLHSRLITPSQNKLYLNSLQQFVKNYEGKAIAADGLVLLGKYYYEKDSLVTALGFVDKAIKLYPKTLGGHNAAVIKNDIKEQELGIMVENINMANKPLLALINYRNVSKAGIAVYKFTPTQQARLQKMNLGWYDTGLSKAGFKYLQSIKPVDKALYVLPDPHDYRRHSAEIKLNTLPVGIYHVLITHSEGNKTLNTLVKFTVTNLAYVMRQNANSAHELRVLDRYSGMPLKNVAVNISRSEYRNNKNITVKVASGVTDGNGRFLFGREDSELRVKLNYKGDVFIDEDRYVTGNVAREASTSFIERSILFTDRQIYRPGQTVYFKLLQLQNRGDSAVILPKQNITVNLFDANSKKSDERRVVTNEFGTASGSFILPQNALPGAMYIRTNNGSVAIQVEEYKRPTFEVEFLPVAENYRLNDSVTVKGMVKAFAGYGIANARVAYNINLHFNNKSIESDIVIGGQEIGGENRKESIATDTVTTDKDGQFSIRFKATDNELSFPAIYEYTVKADVTDAAGETHTASMQAKVSSNSLLIDVLIPQLITVHDNANIKIKLNNANGQPLDGTAQVKIYKLQAPRTAFKERLWAAPDQSIMTREDFIKHFPAYAYHNEDDILTWAKTDTIASWNIAFDKTRSQPLNLGELYKQASGAYEIVIKARTPRGDTASYIQQVIFTNQPGKLQRREDWVTQVRTTVKPGQPAEFLVGTDAPCNVLMEKYDGATLLSSEWLKLNGPLQQNIKVGFPLRKGNFSVQFLMVHNNRVYSSYQSITIKDSVETLPLKFITFRNKLQPGEKEQWKIQVGNNESPARMAEMVATLYDASLDDIQPPSVWTINRSDIYRWLESYFAWDTSDFVSPEAGTDEHKDGGYLTEEERHYEELNLFGYNYYGGYNDAYANRGTSAISVDDLKLNKLYFKNAALVKNGFDAVGRVMVSSTNNLNLPVSGAKIIIPNTKISTLSNSLGYFKIKVPTDGRLILSGPNLITRTVTFKRGQKQVIQLRDRLSFTDDLKTADPGQKDIKGDPTQTVRIDEPVGNAPVSAAVQADAAEISGNRYGYSDQVRFKPPVVKADGPVTKSMQIVDGDGNQLFKQNQVAIRKNFNETAFFHPQLHTDEKGQILIDFTIPESLTKWHFKAFAHTQKLVTGYMEQEIVTQKQLMVSANMPRFMREGDTITVSARVVNLSEQTLDGKVQLKLYNAVNMQPLELLAKKAEGEQGFKIEPGVNQAVSFKLIIPANLDAITYRLTAVTNKFSDGEENTILVLSNRILVTESMPMMVRAGQTKAFTFDKLIAQDSKTLINKSLTLEYTDNPAWYAVQAMPYLMEFPYECSEQIFSRYFANSLSAAIINLNQQIKLVFDTWKTADSKTLLSKLEQNPELKATLLEETPWLQDAATESEQKKRIALLFDLNKLTNEQAQSLEKLHKKQLSNGGFPWFGGHQADRFITQHIIAGIGQISKLNTDVNSGTLKIIETNALRYLNNKLLQDDEQQVKEKNYATRPLSALEIHGWYARSYFTYEPTSGALKKVQQQYLNRAAQQWLQQGIYQQALIALTLHRSGKTDVAQSIISSLIENAQQTNEVGMYWPKNQQGWYWYQSPVETQAALIELFTEVGNNAGYIEEMKIWLLRNKQTTNWRTTKATALACYALLMKGNSLLAPSGASSVKLDGKLLTQLKPDLKKDIGTGYLKASWVDEQVKPEFGKVEISNSAKTISWGAMHWQYTERAENITASSNDITLERKYFIQKQDNNGQPVLIAVDAAHTPKTGDLLKVVAYLKAARDFEYVQLKDMRPAGTEPVDVLSAYKYQGGLWYYQVTKDVATNFFISQLTKGSYVFEYELRVVQPGSFATGISTIQCMYAPEFNAHSKGARFRIE